jgi:hypothetical protein
MYLFKSIKETKDRAIRTFLLYFSVNSGLPMLPFSYLENFSHSKFVIHKHGHT